MNILINYTSRTPIYEQIISEVEKLVTLNILKPDEQIPSIRELAQKLSINPNTVKKAYDILEQKGIITSKSTKGTYITSNVENAKKGKINEVYNRLLSNIQELENYGLSKEEIIRKLQD